MTEEPKRVTRRAALHAAGGAVSGAAVLGALLGAHSPRQAEAGNSQHRIVGTWLNTHTKNGGVAIATFFADGSWSNGHPNRRRSSAQGTWAKGKDGTIVVTRWSLRFNDQGQVIGTLKTRAEVVVDADGDGLTSRRISEGFDLAGNFLGATPIVESRAIRIKVEAPPPH